MKRKWHIRTRLLLTLIGTICAVLLVVALTFNLSIRQYIRLRVSTQLKEVSQDASGQMRKVSQDASDQMRKISQDASGQMREISQDASGQMKEISQDASGQMEDIFRTADGRRFDEHPDRVMGTSGNAVILNSDGSLLFVLHGDEETGADLRSSQLTAEAMPSR